MGHPLSKFSDIPAAFSHTRTKIAWHNIVSVLPAHRLIANARVHTHTYRGRIQDFPEGVSTPKEEARTYYSAKISRKLHTSTCHIDRQTHTHTRVLTVVEAVGYYPCPSRRRPYRSVPVASSPSV